MKKKLLAGSITIVATVALLGCNQQVSTPSPVQNSQNTVSSAEPTSQATSMATETQVTTPSNIGLLMSNGKMLVMKDDGSSDDMTKDMVLTNGIKVAMDGKITMADGRMMLLPDGIGINLDGTLSDNDYLNINDKRIQGFVMKGGSMMIIMEGGNNVPMDTDVGLSNGTVIQMDGTVMKKDGTYDNMKEGQSVDLNGKIK